MRRANFDRLVETTINEIVARRMVKKQQMRWNRWTVQPFLDVRVAVLDGTLEGSSGEVSTRSSVRPMITMKSPRQRELPTLLHSLHAVSRGSRH